MLWATKVAEYGVQKCNLRVSELVFHIPTLIKLWGRYADGIFVLIPNICITFYFIAVFFEILSKFSDFVN